MNTQWRWMRVFQGASCQGCSKALFLLLGLGLWGHIPALAQPLINLNSPEIYSAQATDMTVVPPHRVSRPTLRPGSQGEAVREIQALLQLLGYYSGPVSGQYQETTQQAVQQFQTAAGLNADGIVGPATWSSLFPAPPGEANPPSETGSSTPDQETATTVATSTPTSTTETTPPATPQTTETPDGGENMAPAAATTPSPSSTDASSQAESRPVLRPGAEGSAVRQLQETLKSLGFYQGPIDGLFGSQTEEAVKTAQQNYGLNPDGIVGPATWAALLQE